MKKQPTTPATLAAWRSLLGLSLACTVITSASAGEYTAVKPYAVAVSSDYAIQPLLSVGDRVPNTSDPSKLYQMVGIPDGLGAVKGQGGTTILYMNHELTFGSLSEPNVGGPTNRGALVSRFILNKNGGVISGKRAYDWVVDEETGIRYPAAEVGNDTPAFGRFCSGSIAYREAGFDRPIYFANEEGTGFDPKGQLTWAVFDNEIHSLVDHGRFPWENALVRPDAGDWTVVMGLKDGPSTPRNPLYMYVGKKDRSRGASVLSRNGLDTGKLYTFVAAAGSPANETNFTSGSITGQWVELSDQDHVTAAELEIESMDVKGAFGFVRVEDGAWSKTDKNTFYFNTTGTGTPGARLGNTYVVNFDKRNILGPTKISVIYNGDAVAAAGGDVAFAPDNMDASKDYLMVQEDGTAQSSPEYAKRARDGSIWRYDLKCDYAAKRVVELNPPGTVLGTNGVPPSIGPGIWETSGIIDASDFFGKDSWLFVVQAHSPAIAPVPNTVEDGQLLLMLPSRVKIDNDNHDDDDHYDRD